MDEDTKCYSCQERESIYCEECTKSFISGNLKEERERILKIIDKVFDTTDWSNFIISPEEDFRDKLKKAISKKPSLSKEEKNGNRI